MVSLVGPVARGGESKREEQDDNQRSGRLRLTQYLFASIPDDGRDEPAILSVGFLRFRIQPTEESYV